MRGAAPAQAWVRPALVLLGGFALAGLLVVADQWIGAVAVALFTLFMAYWTSPLRSSPHTPLATARQHPAPGTAIILWAPGNPLSARLQTAIRGPREDVIWVNTFRDPAATELLAQHGGPAALPLALVGAEVRANATAGELLDLQEAERLRRSAEGESADG